MSTVAFSKRDSVSCNFLQHMSNAMDEEDFRVKLDSPRESWDKLVPGFHEWFQKKS